MTARGIVVSQSPTILVQPLDTAIVRSIDVREGQEVQAGQLLARLDPTFASADFAALDAQVSNLEAQVARLQAEAEGKPFSYNGPIPIGYCKLSIYSHRKAEFEAKVDNYRHRIDELAAVIPRSDRDAAAYRERLGCRAEYRGHAQTGSRSWKPVASSIRCLPRILAWRWNALQLMQSKRRKGRSAIRKPCLAERDAYIGGWRADALQKLSETRRARLATLGNS